MRPGRGGPSGVCDKYSGAQREYCESLEKECLEKGSEDGSGEGGKSKFDIVDCSGMSISTDGRLCSSMVGYLAEDWSSCSASGGGGKTHTAGAKPSDGNGAEVKPEKKKWAPKSLPRKKPGKPQGILLVNESTAPSRYKGGALVVANIQIPEHRDAILAFWKKHPSEGMALLNVGYTDDKSRAAAVADLASVLRISEDKAGAIVDSKLCFTLSWKDGAVVPTVLAAVKKPSPAKKRRWARRGVAPEGKPQATKEVVTLGEEPKVAQKGASPDENPQTKKKVVTIDEKSKATKKSVTIDEKPKAEQKGAEPNEKPADAPKKQKVSEQLHPKTITWPHGFIESSPETIDGIVSEINGADYPVMVVVGQEAKNLGERNCSHCVEFKKELLAAQGSGEWAYHRLVFINLNRSWAMDHLKKLDIHSEVVRAGFVPQAFVFEGGYVVSPTGDMSAYMKGLRKEVSAAAKAGESVKQPSAEVTVMKPVEEKPERKISEAERKKLEAEEKKRAAEEAKRAAEEQKRLEAEEKKRADEEKKRLEEEEKQRKVEEERRLKEEAEAKVLAEKKARVDARFRKAASMEKEGAAVRKKLAGKILTRDNVAQKWRSPMEIVVTATFDEEFKRSVDSWGRIYVVDWSDPSGRELAANLGISPLSSGMGYEIWTLDGNLSGGRFDGEPSYGGGMEMSAGQLLDRYGMKPDANGFLFVDGTTFDTNFNPDSPMSIVVVGDPGSPDAAETIARLADEKLHLDEQWQLVWLPHTDKNDARAQLAELGIPPNPPKTDGSLKIWRVSYTGGFWSATKHTPSGFVDVVSKRDAIKYLHSDDSRTLLVVGRRNGKGAEATRLLKRIVVEDHSGKGLDIDGMAVDKVCFMDERDARKIYKKDDGIIKYLDLGTMLPHVFLFEGKKNNRRVLDIPIESVAEHFELFDMSKEEEPPKGEESGGLKINLKVRERGPGIIKTDQSFRVSQLSVTSIVDLKSAAQRVGHMIFIWGPQEAMKGDVAKLGQLIYDGREEIGVFLATDGGNDIQMASLKAFKLDGKPLPEKGVAECQRGSKSEVWSCKPYDLTK